MILGTYNIIFERFDFFHFWTQHLLYNGYNIKTNTINHFWEHRTGSSINTQ